MKTIIFGALMLIASVSFGQTINITNSTGCDIHVRFYFDDAPDVGNCMNCSVNVCIPSGTSGPISVAGCGNFSVTAADIRISNLCTSITPCTSPSLIIAPPGSACIYPPAATGPTSGASTCGCTNATFTGTWFGSTTLIVN